MVPQALKVAILQALLAACHTFNVISLHIFHTSYARFSGSEANFAGVDVVLEDSAHLLEEVLNEAVLYLWDLVQLQVAILHQEVLVLIQIADLIQQIVLLLASHHIEQLVSLSSYLQNFKEHRLFGHYRIVGRYLKVVVLYQEVFSHLADLMEGEVEL